MRYQSWFRDDVCVLFKLKSFPNLAEVKAYKHRENARRKASDKPELKV